MYDELKDMPLLHMVLFWICMILSCIPFAQRLCRSKPPRQVGYQMGLADFFMAAGLVVAAIFFGSFFGGIAAKIYRFDGDAAMFAGSSIMHISAILLMAFFLLNSDAKPDLFLRIGVLKRLKIFCKGAGFLLGFFLCITAVSGIWVALLGLLGYEIQPQVVVESFGKISGGGKVFAFVSIAVLAPVAEELVFRGVMYGALKGKIGAAAAAVVVSVVFALIHFSMPAFLPIFLLSIVLILLYERYGDLTAPIAAHCAFNSIMAVLILFRVELLNG